MNCNPKFLHKIVVNRIQEHVKRIIHHHHNPRGERKEGSRRQRSLACCSPQGHKESDLTVHGILQATTLEWVAISSSRGSSQPRDRTHVSCTAHRFFTFWATREALSTLYIILKQHPKIDYPDSEGQTHQWNTALAINWNYISMVIPLSPGTARAPVCAWINLWSSPDLTIIFPIYCFSSVQLLSRSWFFATPWTSAHQALWQVLWI